MKSKYLQKNSYTVMLLGLMVVTLLFFTVLKGNLMWKGDVWAGIAMQFPEYGVIALGADVLLHLRKDGHVLHGPG